MLTARDSLSSPSNCRFTSARPQRFLGGILRCVLEHAADGGASLSTQIVTQSERCAGIMLLLIQWGMGTGRPHARASTSIDRTLGA